MEAIAIERRLEPELDPGTYDAVAAYTKVVSKDAQVARESLGHVRPGRINALLPMLEYNDSQRLFEAHRLQTSIDQLPEEPRDALARR